VLQPAVLVKHPLFKSIYEAHVGGTLAHIVGASDGSFLDELGLSSENIMALQLPLMLQVSEIPEEHRANFGGDRHRLEIKIDGIAVETTQPVAWKKVSELIAPQLLPPEQLERLAVELARFDQQTAMQIASDSIKNRESEHSAELRSVWEEVSNCPLAIASATPDDLELQINDEDDVIDARSLFSAVDATAIGIALDSDNVHPQVRIAFAQREGRSAAEVFKLAENTQARILATGQAVLALRPDSLSDETKLKAMEQLLDDFGSLTLEIAAAEDGSETVLATMQTTTDLAKLLP
jgi:hypothetical protein